MLNCQAVVYWITCHWDFCEWDKVSPSDNRTDCNRCILNHFVKSWGSQYFPYLLKRQTLYFSQIFLASSGPALCLINQYNTTFDISKLYYVIHIKYLWKKYEKSFLLIILLHTLKILINIWVPFCLGVSFGVSKIG